MRFIKLFAGIFAMASFLGATPSSALAGPCDAPAYHQYDFFVGNWIVTHKNGRQFATDVVTKQLNNCTVWERWYGRTIHGLGYSSYDVTRHRWVQAFFGDDGSVSISQGYPHPGGLLFRWTDYPKPRVAELNKVDFRKLPAGVVEEYWLTSTDRGKTWKVAFDGFFHRR